MGNSASSLLDDANSNFIKGRAEAELREFSPYYRKQFSLARFSKVEDDLEQHKEKITQLLKQRGAPEGGEVLYEDPVLYFDDTRKWRERYVVVRANYCLECHDGLESFVKGIPPRQNLLPTGGTVLTTEEKYMVMVDKCFPDDTSAKEDFAPPLSGMPGQFPVYLRLPYRRDYYFCFRNEAKKEAFLSILSDCIRHQNHDFLKKKTCEVQAFLKAIQLYRQDKGQYEPWDMLIGSDVRVMANLVMEQLLPILQKDLLPRLKSKKAERKRVWFATVEAAYIVVQERLLEGLAALKEECQTSVRQQEVLIHSDMDQILNTRRQLEEKVRDRVSARAEKLFSESVQPYLASVLEELMEPVSCGFLEGRQLSEHAMDQVCQDVLRLADKEELRKALADMARPNLLSCYQKIASLQERLQDLQKRFGLSSISRVIYSAQIDLQQLIENAAYTFELLLHKAVQDNPNNPGPAIEKAKPRVLKQYDYDSSTVRKRISREALVYITLPFIKKTLSSCRTELQGLEQSVYAEHSNFIHIENIYESILLESLDKEVTKVVKEAASLKKYNLFTDSRDLLSQSSRSSLSSPPVSTPGTPAMELASLLKTSVEPQPPSPLVLNGPSSVLLREGQPEKSVNLMDTPLVETPPGVIGQKDAPKIVTVAQEAEPTSLTEAFHTVGEAGPPTSTASETQMVKVEASPETVIQKEETSAEPETTEMAAEPQVQRTDAPKEAEVALPEIPTVAESTKTNVEDAAAQRGAPAPSRDPTNEPQDLLTKTTVSVTTPSSVKEMNCGNSEINIEAPPSGQTPELLSDIHPSMDMKLLEAEPVTASVSVGSEMAPSEVESTVDMKTAQNSEDEVPEASGKSPVSSGETRGDEPSPQAQTEAAREGGGGRDAEAGASVEPSAEAADSATCPAAEPAEEESPEAKPIGCIKEIRDLVEEVIEVEELVKRYPCGVPREEEEEEEE
uniref:Niban apoptosis regulator 1a n=1 Tax=Gasterosteus aculeatus aculeatus TaxID=481459 RepID=G3NMZ7_GASAC|nr:protein Niban 1a [Gasterosteus aculeatus aculeatus]